MTYNYTPEAVQIFSYSFTNISEAHTVYHAVYQGLDT